MNDLEKLSRGLSKVLRHNAIKEGLHISTGGYVLCEDILKINEYNTFTFEDIETVVKTNDKKRFNLKNIDNKYYIRAIQGHSKVIASVLKIEDLLTKLHEPLDLIIHGTSMDKYNLIINCGLQKKGKWLIHFSTTHNFIEESHLPSIYKSKCRILIYINMKLAMENGISFYMCDNGIIHSPGFEEEGISSKYFIEVMDTRTKKILLG